jgi:hypothetical protein
MLLDNPGMAQRAIFPDRSSKQKVALVGLLLTSLQFGFGLIPTCQCPGYARDERPKQSSDGMELTP